MIRCSEKAKEYKAHDFQRRLAALLFLSGMLSFANSCMETVRIFAVVKKESGGETLLYRPRWGPETGKIKK